ncbi:MAG: hypothetical protein GY903_16020 [Fuerstiella sp.]|nr:hypothetical protein [Fuerstiella sp.]MCP4855990.1 hypothetical protein [Fuerstiella sp.]
MPLPRNQSGCEFPDTSRRLTLSNLHVTLWHIDARQNAGTPEGHGVAFTAQKFTSEDPELSDRMETGGVQAVAQAGRLHYDKLPVWEHNPRLHLIRVDSVVAWHGGSLIVMIRPERSSYSRAAGSYEV